jgi:hypothetical protein
MVEAAFWGALSASSLLLGAMIALPWSIPPRALALVMVFGAGALISALSAAFGYAVLDTVSLSVAAFFQTFVAGA